MLNFNLNTENKEEWLTPPEIIRSLGEFDLDPCYLPPDQRPWETAKESYWKEIDGLRQTWSGRIWCNPPYGKKTFEWIRKLADHGNGIALIFARTETKGFHNEVFPKADGIFFFKGRISFHYITGQKASTSNASSCLIAFGYQNCESIRKFGLNGKLIPLK